LKLRFLIIAITLFSSLLLPAQEYDENGKEIWSGNREGLNVGFQIGCYFANNYTASLYDGYGLDIDGLRNSFENSFMYNKIILQYGGMYGQPDLVADALGVNHGDWVFNESDMPTNMRYQPAFLIGLQLRYSVDKANAILLNVNAIKLNINGNFTITTRPPSGSSQINNSVQTQSIRGVEQRLGFQVGYQHIFYEEKNINPMLEGGMNVTLAKFDRNEILIGESLLIDLTEYYYQPGYNAFSVRRPIGVGFGAFAGLGVNVNMSEDFRLQLLYMPSYEGINLGPNTGLRFQHDIGLRVYYGF
jgi:hypothetical protein